MQKYKTQYITYKHYFEILLKMIIIELHLYTKYTNVKFIIVEIVITVKIHILFVILIIKIVFPFSLSILRRRRKGQLLMIFPPS